MIVAIHDEGVDVGFVEGLAPLDGLQARPVARDEIVLVVTAGHRWARRRAIRPDELPASPWSPRPATWSRYR